MLCVQHQLLVHVTLPVEKSAQFNHAVKLKSGDRQRQLTQCNGKNIQYYLPNYTRFFLPRHMIDRKFNHGDTRRCVA